MMQAKNEESTLPSITALSVAAAFHRALDTRYTYLFSNKELELIQHFVTTGIALYPYSFNGALMKSISVLPYSFQQGFFNKVVIPAYDEIIMLRKLMIRHKLNEAITNGAKQVVILGGGYDIRAFVAAQEYPEVMFYELDKGKTRQHKLQAIRTIPAEYKIKCDLDESSPGMAKINNNLFCIEADLNETRLSEILSSCGFQCERQSFFLAEGLTCYLNEKSNQSLLNSIHHVFKHDQSELLISYITKTGYYSAVAETAHTESYEKHQFSLSIDEVIPFAEKSSFDIVAKKSSTDMLENIGQKDSAQFFKNNQNIREYYYMFKPQIGTVTKKKTIHEVPEMHIHLPLMPLVKENTCLKM